MNKRFIIVLLAFVFVSMANAKADIPKVWEVNGVYTLVEVESPSGYGLIKSITIGNEYAYNSTEIKIVVIDGGNSVRIDWVAEGNRYPVTYSVGYDNTVIIPNFLRRRFIVSVEYTFAGSMAGIQYAYETRVFEIRS